jgi:t-SNARE complex subunit (syntaxin)
MAAADVVVQASRAEGASTVLREAQAAGELKNREEALSYIRDLLDRVE